MNRVELMKGICHIWSRGRHFSPSMPGDRYLKLSSQKRSPGRNLGEHRLVRRSGTTSRGTVLLAFCLRMLSFLIPEILTIFVGKSIRVSICTLCVILVTLNDLRIHLRRSREEEEVDNTLFTNVRSDVI